MNQRELIAEFLKENGYYNLNSKVANGVMVRKNPTELYREYRNSYDATIQPYEFHRAMEKKNFFCFGSGRNAFYELWVDEMSKI